MSSEEYTPTNAGVRAYYVHGRALVCAVSETRLVLEFDRWLAAHDAEIRAERVAPKAERVSRDAIIAEVIDWLEWRAVIRFDEGELETEVDSHIMESLDAARKFFAIPVDADTYRNSYQKEQTDEQ